MMKRISENTPRLLAWSVPLVLLIAILLAYALFVRELGFYWDDWPSVWFNAIGGTEIFDQVFSSDRPLLGRLFMLTMPIMGSSILRWQMFAILMRWLCGVSFFWFLNLLWKDRLAEKAFASLVFVLYPGFKQQFVAVTYSHVFLVYTFFVLSLCLMLLALRKKALFLPLYALAVGLSLAAVFSAEYFIALEILRPLLIFWMLGRDSAPSNANGVGQLGDRIKEALVYWLPFVVAVGAFSYWRIFIHGFPRARLLAPGEADSASSLMILFVKIIQDLLEMTIGAWGQVFNPAILTDFNAILYTRFLWPVALIFGLLLAAYLLRMSRFEPHPIGLPSVWGLRAIFLGGLALVIGALPFWAVDLPYRLSFPYDRVVLPVIFGASILIAGLLDLTISHAKARAILASALIVVSVIFQWHVADTYIKENNDVRTFFWQLSWRMPDIRPGTILLVPEWPFHYNTDNSLSALMNWVYAASENRLSMPYLMMDLGTRIGSSLPGSKDENTGRITILRDADVRTEYRGLTFAGNSGEMLVIDFSPPACLRLYDPQSDALLPLYGGNTHTALALSNRDRVLPGTNKNPWMPFALFGKEIKKDWCHYYLEAELAAQSGRWEDVVGLAHTAFDEHHMKPQAAVEYIPFIDGLIESGKTAEALTFSLDAVDQDYRIGELLCRKWTEVQRDNAVVSDEPRYQLLMEQAGCSR